MPLVRLIYYSTKSDSVTIEEIERILANSRKNNIKENITGMLCFQHDCFLQILEGHSSRVCNLYNKIAGDKRHRSVVISEYSEISNREFGNWSMGYIPGSNITAPDILKFSSERALNPSQMSSKSILRMVLALKEKIPLG